MPKYHIRFGGWVVVDSETEREGEKVIEGFLSDLSEFSKYYDFEVESSGEEEDYID